MVKKNYSHSDSGWNPRLGLTRLVWWFVQTEKLEWWWSTAQLTVTPCCNIWTLCSGGYCLRDFESVLTLKPKDMLKSVLMKRFQKDTTLLQRCNLWILFFPRVCVISFSNPELIFPFSPSRWPQTCWSLPNSVKSCWGSGKSLLMRLCKVCRKVRNFFFFLAS